MHLIEKYITIEGVDTVGKSTQMALLESSLKGRAIFTREPGRMREGIFEMIKTGVCEASEFLLFLSDRVQHFIDVIAPNEGRLIISDRSLISGVAYSGFDLAFDFHKSLAQMKLLAAPSGVVLLRLDKETLRSRLNLKKADLIESRGVDYLLGVQDKMIEVANSLGAMLRVIDAGGSVDEVRHQIEDFLREMHCL